MNNSSKASSRKNKYLSALFLVLFFGLGFTVTDILNRYVAKNPQTTSTRAQGLSPIQEATCTSQGGECQTGKANQVGRPCTLSDGMTPGIVIRDLCPQQPDDIRCCVPNGPPVDNPPEPTFAIASTNLTVRLQGIGPNANVQNKTRNMIIKIFNNDGSFDAAEYVAQDAVTYDPASGNFVDNNFNLGALPPGDYQMVIQAEKYLDKQLVNSQGKNIITVASGTAVDIAPIELRAGDIAPGIRGDNAVNIIDYNALIGCLPGAPPGSCLNRDYADLNDDGKVDQIDLDILMSNFGQNGFSFRTDEFKCDPDPTCNSGKDSLQLCSLVCTRISKRS